MPGMLHKWNGCFGALVLALAACTAALRAEVDTRVRPLQPDKPERIAPSTPIEPPVPIFVPPLQTRAPRTYETFEELRGIRKGPLVFRPTYDTSMTYDDNIFGTRRKDAQDDFIYTTSPGLDLTYKPSQGFTIRSAYAFGWNNYLDDVARDFHTHSHNISLSWTDPGIRGLSLGLQNTYNQSGNTQVLDDEFFSFTRVQGNASTATASYQRKALGFTTSYSYGLTDYFGREFEGSGHEQHQVNTIFHYNLSPKLIPYLRYRYDATRPSEDSFDTHEIAAGTRARVGPWNVDFFVGNSRTILLDPYDSSDGLVIGANATYTFNEAMHATGSASRTFRTGVLTGSAYDNELEFAFHRRFGRRMMFDAFVLGVLSERSDGNQLTLQYNMRFAGRISKNMTGHLEYNRFDRSSDTGPDVPINRIQVGFSMRF